MTQTQVVSVVQTVVQPDKNKFGMTVHFEGRGCWARKGSKVKKLHFSSSARYIFARNLDKGHGPCSKTIM